MKSRLHVLLSLLALQVSSALSFAYQFELDGTMTCKPWNHAQISYSIQVYVQDCQWAIFKTYEWTTNRCVTEMSSDGDYIYYLDRFETNIGTVKPEDYTQAYPNGWNGEIHPASFPYDNLNTEGIALFYAYASSCYLNTHANQVVGSIPFCPTDLRRRDEEAQYAKIIRSPVPPGLPTEVVFLVPFQYETNAVFAASEFTNIGAAQIPLNVRITRYASNHTSILATYEFQVKRVAGVCSLKSFKPALPGRALITDYRVPHFFAGDPGSCRMVTGSWPTLQAE